MLEQKKLYVECECGTHLLQVTSDVETFDDKETNTKRFRQEFWLAMFEYGYHEKLNFWKRLCIGWNYLKTGKMHEDSLILSPDEAKKLALFIVDNIVKGEKEISENK